MQGPEALQQRKVRTAPWPGDTITEAPTPAQAQQRLKAERVQLRLKQMPTWKLKTGGKAIDRVRQFPDALTAASYLAFAALLARQSGQRLWASVQGNTITVTLNHYLTDKSKWPGIDRAFGGSEWREILDTKSSMRSQRFLQLYDEALKTRGKASFSYSFSMHDKNDQLLYWLVFCSNSDRGLEEMKKAMWSVDSTGYFRFSDKHSGQFNLLPGFDQNWLAGTLHSSLEGREMSVEQVRHYVLTETPCYTYTEALTQLERNGEIELPSSPPGRRKGWFAKYVDDDRLVIRFINAPRNKQLSLLD